HAAPVDVVEVVARAEEHEDRGALLERRGEVVRVVEVARGTDGGLPAAAAQRGFELAARRALAPRPTGGAAQLEPGRGVPEREHRAAARVEPLDAVEAQHVRDAARAEAQAWRAVAPQRRRRDVVEVPRAQPRRALA